MAVSIGPLALRPILYVADPYAERDFLAAFGFSTEYEGDDFPGFLAVRHGEVVIGLSSNRGSPPAVAHLGTQWQFTVGDVDPVVEICRRDGWQHEVEVCESGDSYLVRIVHVTSPNGVIVWFEGPNERA